MVLDLRSAGFSMPLGGSLYPSPPYEFRDAEQVTLGIQVDADPVRALLPSGVRPDAVDGAVYCELRLCHYHWSVFGPFLETYVLVRVVGHASTPYYFLPLIFTDSEAPLAAGRELWGYPKKLASMTWEWGGSGRATLGEQLLFTVRRPASTPLFTAVFTPERQADPSERSGLPVVSHRLLPPSDPARPRAADELIELASPKTLQRDAVGAPRLWAGRGSVTFHGDSEVDPWHLFRPRRVVAGYWQVSDFHLPFGRVVHDYAGVDLSGPGQGSDRPAR